VSSAEETNKDLVRRFFEALAQRDLDALEEMMVPDFVNHTKLPDREDYLGREGYKRRVADEQAAFSDFRFII
jgi:ketosteroid isomerase-like protein